MKKIRQTVISFVVLILVIALTACNDSGGLLGSDDDLPDEAVEALKEEEFKVYGKNEYVDFRVTSKMKAPHPEKSNYIRYVARADEAWCVSVEHDDPYKDHNFILYRIGLSWNAHTLYSFPPEDDFLEIGCTNYVEE